MKKLNKLFATMLLIFFFTNFILMSAENVNASEFRNQGTGKYSNTIVNTKNEESLRINPLGLDGENVSNTDNNGAATDNNDAATDNNDAATDNNDAADTGNNDAATDNNDAADTGNNSPKDRIEVTIEKKWDDCDEGTNTTTGTTTGTTTTAASFFINKSLDPKLFRTKEDLESSHEPGVVEVKIKLNQDESKNLEHKVKLSKDNNWTKKIELDKDFFDEEENFKEGILVEEISIDNDVDKVKEYELSWIFDSNEKKITIENRKKCNDSGILEVEKKWIGCDYVKSKSALGTIIIEPLLDSNIDYSKNISFANKEKKLNLIDEFLDYEIRGTELKNDEIPVKSIKFILYKNGEKTNEEFTLDEQNSWKKTIDVSEYLYDEEGNENTLFLVETSHDKSEGSFNNYKTNEVNGEIVLENEEFSYWSIIYRDEDQLKAKVFNYKKDCNSSENPVYEDKEDNKPSKPSKPSSRRKSRDKTKSEDNIKVKEDIKELKKLDKDNHIQYIQGYKDGKLRPEREITREEVAAVFFRILDKVYREEIEVSTHGYYDFEKSRWSSKHIGTLSNAGIIEGYPGNEFKPRKNITRAEVAAIASRFDNLEKVSKSKFKDVNGHWAEKYIDSAERKGWIKGYPDGTFKPNQEITRAEFVTLVNNVLNRKVRKENILKDINKFEDLDPKSWYYEAMVEATNSHTYSKTRLEDNSEIWEDIIYPKIDM